MNDNQKTVFVFENWSNNHPCLMGRLFIDRIRGKETYSFEFEKKWLTQGKRSVILDPELSFYPGRQYPFEGDKLFGMFSDSCPDRWGRTLLRRREAMIAKEENRKPRTLSETDYLLGVYDRSRMGAIRFSFNEDGPFLSDDEDLSNPPWTTLRELETAAISVDSEKGPAADKWLRQLIAPGSSLGGARPKASILAPDNSLWIAKFPSKNDETDTGAWEMVAHELARRCGLNVPEARYEKLSKYGTTYLSKRFDRNGEKRFHFASAMSLLGKTDQDENGSYLDIASFIKAYGAQPKKDLNELWKRIIFSIFISNTDDHLRNHGFLLTDNGWKLTPAYDINPVPYGDHLSLCINEDDDTMSLDLALETAEIYGISKPEAEEYISEFSKNVKRNWQYLAKKAGIAKSEIDYMAPAFVTI